MAGIHLLNESDGTYNRSAVNKYFPQGGVRLASETSSSRFIRLSPENVRS